MFNLLVLICIKTEFIYLMYNSAFKYIWFAFLLYKFVIKILYKIFKKGDAFCNNHDDNIYMPKKGLKYSETISLSLTHRQNRHKAY